MADKSSSSELPENQLGLLFPEAKPLAQRETRHIWNVAELVGEVRARIEREFADCWVEGEISNLRPAASGHVYFTLKDGEAQLPVVLFRRQASLLRFRPEDGLHILVRGRVSVYEQRGQMQLIAETLEPVGAGSLQLAFEQLKVRLQAEGLFALERKRPLPAFPRCVGIITSSAGAVIRDFVNVAGRRHAALEILLYPATVQGESAAAEITAGILYFNQTRNVDVIVLARGGGSLEDLAAFNTELLARAIARSELPVVSAVGHETDFTIADFVADLRAPTPSASAELITAALHKVEERVDELQLRALRAMRYQHGHARQRFARLSADATLGRMLEALARRQQRVDECQARLLSGWQTFHRAECAELQELNGRLLRQGASHGVGARRERMLALERRISHRMLGAMRARRERVEAVSARLLRQNSYAHLKAASDRATGLSNRLLHLWTERMRWEEASVTRASSNLMRYGPLGHIRSDQEKTANLAGRLERGQRATLLQKQSHAERLQGRLADLSPLAVLERGYAVVFGEDGAILRRSEQARNDEVIKTRLGRGSLKSRVIGKDA
ncbi:MAG: exodeoxyribonuclease VII large subunit [Acidobacteriaceae bacterium]